MKKKKKERLAVPSLNLPRLTRPVLGMMMNDDDDDEEKKVLQSR